MGSWFSTLPPTRINRYVESSDAGIWTDDPYPSRKGNDDYGDLKSLGASSPEQMARYLDTEKKEHPLMKAAMEKAEKYYKEKNIKDKILTHPLKDLPEICKIAILAYTLEEPSLYQEFNRVSRELFLTLSWENFPFKGLWLLLNYLSSTSSTTNLPVYRGISIPYHVKVGQKITFYQITSTSANPQATEPFMNSNNNTLFVIRPRKGLLIKELSCFGNEEEYILPPYSTFTVMSITEKHKHTEIHLAP